MRVKIRETLFMVREKARTSNLCQKMLRDEDVNRNPIPDSKTGRRREPECARND